MQDGPASAQIRLLVADEISRVVRDLEALQQESGEIVVCGLARTPAALLEEARRLQPDVVLINEGYFGNANIFFAVAELAHVVPGATIISITPDPAAAERRGRKAGVHGYVAAAAPTEEIVHLIHTLRDLPAPGVAPPAPAAPLASEPLPPAEPVTETAAGQASAPPDDAPFTETAPDEPPAEAEPATEEAPTEEAPAEEAPAEEAHGDEATPVAPEETEAEPVAEPAEALTDVPPGAGEASTDDDSPSGWGLAPGQSLDAEPAPPSPGWGLASGDPLTEDQPPATPAETPASWFGSETGDASETAETGGGFPAGEAPEETPFTAHQLREPDYAQPDFAATVIPEVPEEAVVLEQQAPEDELEPIQPVKPRRIRRGSRAKAEIFFVFSGKGGVGKSTIAANIAVALAEERNAHVAVVDLDLQFGDLGILFGIEPKHSIEALADQGEQVDPEYLDDTLADGPSGIRVLLAPPSPELADLVTAANLRSILRELSKTFDYVVVDGPAHLEERTLEVIELAEQLVVVTAFNVTAVKDTKVTLKVLSSLGIDKEKIAIVLNQTRAKINFTREQVEENLRFRVVSQLPYDPRVVDDAVDHGKPFVTADPKAEISRQIRALVDFLAPPSAEEQSNRPKEATRGEKDKVNRRRFSLGRG